MVRRTLFGIIAAALAVLYMAGATTAAFACSVPQVTANAPMSSDCDGHQKVRDCALSCALVCIAVAPTAAQALDAGPRPSSGSVPRDPAAARSIHTAPEPPPPRASQPHT